MSDKKNTKFTIGDNDDERVHELEGLSFVTDVTRETEGEKVATNHFNEISNVTLPRRVEITQDIIKKNLVKDVETFQPKIQVQEIVRTVPIKKIEYEEEIEYVEHQHIVDRYEEVPVPNGKVIEKKVPQIEVINRKIEAEKPIIKWNEKIVEIPEVHEVVRYVEEGTEVEQVIKYVPSGPLPTWYYKREEEKFDYTTREQYEAMHKRKAASTTSPSEELLLDKKGEDVDDLNDKRATTSDDDSEHSSEFTQFVKVEPDIVETGDEQAEVSIPVPYLVPKVNKVEVEVPVIKFVDHFVPVPVRRHVIPQITFSEDIYQVEVIHEKPVLVVQDFNQPVAVDAKIKIIEKDLEIIPMNPIELSQGDMLAMWMRCNADLLDLYQLKHEGKLPYGYCPENTTDNINRMAPNQYETDLLKEEELRVRNSSARDPDHLNDHPAPQNDCLPLHPGHPAMMPVLQNQWLNLPSTHSQQIQGDDYHKAYTAALNQMTDPKPHLLALSEEQIKRIKPIPQEIMPQPWQYVPKNNAERLTSVNFDRAEGYQNLAQQVINQRNNESKSIDTDTNNFFCGNSEKTLGC